MIQGSILFVLSIMLLATEGEDGGLTSLHIVGFVLLLITALIFIHNSDDGDD